MPLNARTTTAPIFAAGGLVLAAWAANEANRYVYGHTTLEAMDRPLRRQFTAALIALVAGSTVFGATAQVWLKVT
jgi:hypothetical protein